MESRNVTHRPDSDDRPSKGTTFERAVQSRRLARHREHSLASYTLRIAGMGILLSLLVSATVDVAPSSATAQVRGEVPFVATTQGPGGYALAGRVATWLSSAESVATVDSNGLATAHNQGSANITATRADKTGSAVLSVQPSSPPPPPPPGVADPTLLPLARDRRPNKQAYDALNITAMAAGGWYTDPAVGTTIYKISDATVSSGGVVPDYSESGPYISLPWGANGEMRTLYLLMGSIPHEHWLVDFNTETGTLSNWRNTPVTTREATWSFSSNPATPRIAYYRSGIDGDLHRYNTGTMSNEDTGNFPAPLDTWMGDGNYTWLQHDKDDRIFVVSQGGSTDRVTWWNSQTNGHASYNVNLDEPYLDKAGNYVVVNLDSSSDGALWRLSDGQTVNPVGLPGLSHGACVQGYMVSWEWMGTQPTTYRYDLANGTVTTILAGNELAPAGHRAGQWVVDNGSGLFQWMLHSHFSNNPSWSDPTPGYVAIVFHRLDGSPPHILAHHYSWPDGDYRLQPHATISPDGKVVMWGSSMGVQGGRADTFLALVPTR